MARSLSWRRRVGTAARWPVGVLWTSWRYMWRTTPMHRRETPRPPEEIETPPTVPPGEDVQPARAGVGPLYHRRYRVQIAEPQISARELMAKLHEDPDNAAPGELATFVKSAGEEGRMSPGDEYVVRLAGPWDGPVRVVEVTPESFRLITLEGHLEAGQIRFSARDVADGEIEFVIESWARSGDRLSNVLYTHVRMAKEIQLHMWTSYLERAAALAGGKRRGGVDIETERAEAPAGVG